jgi:hypothetical protein
MLKIHEKTARGPFLFVAGSASRTIKARTCQADQAKLASANFQFTRLDRKVSTNLGRWLR